jgi:hypothetical protein
MLVDWEEYAAPTTPFTPALAWSNAVIVAMDSSLPFVVNWEMDRFTVGGRILM